MSKTLKECKDEVARFHGLYNWEFLMFTWAGFGKLIEPFMDEAAERYADQFKPKWISVKDRLPSKEGESYLVGVKNKNKEGGIFLYDIGYFEEGVFHKSGTWEDVTHWMPLPAAPERKEEGV